MSSRGVLAVALLALAALFGYWFLRDGNALLAAVVGLPPLLLALLLKPFPRVAGFCAGVLALAWFSHGVMIAWSDPAQRWLALAETALAVVVVFAANADALRARLARRRQVG